MDAVKNTDRFSGFTGLYEEVRPAMPLYAVQTVTRYLGRTPGLVVDLGCGTGLSTAVWAGRCERAVGIEPNADMLAVARQKAAGALSFLQGYGHQTGLESGSADAVVCSQSFHWMEPGATLAEVDRILAPGGVFAAVDCDWPPVSAWRADMLFEQLDNRFKELEASLADVKNTFVRYGKDAHLANIRASGYFRYAREVVFACTESCTARRFIGLLLSQGSLQAVRKRHPGLLAADIAALEDEVRGIFKDEPFSIDFCYRMRLAVK